MIEKCLRGRWNSAPKGATPSLMILEKRIPLLHLKTADPKETKGFCRYFSQEKRMRFVPITQHKIAYEQTIQPELSRLNGKERENFYYKLSREGYVAVFNSALEKARTPVN